MKAITNTTIETESSSSSIKQDQSSGSSRSLESSENNPETHSYYSASITNNNQIASVSKVTRQQTNLLLVSLIESLCRTYGDSPDARRKIFLIICQTLNSLGFIDYSEFIDETAGVRSTYHQLFERLFFTAAQRVQQQQNDVKLLTLHGEEQQETDMMTTLKFDFIQPSRYNNDFIEAELLGRGGFASAYRAKNKLDDIEYAIKKIRLVLDHEDYDKVFREIKHLARLEHPNVIRYYTSWLEYAQDDCLSDCEDDEDYDTSEEETDDYIQFGNNTTSLCIQDQEQKEAKGSYVLFIQMQLCPSTLLEFLKIRNQNPSEYFDAEQNRDLFRQILEGTAYIHQQGLIHRDLKPGNIFLSRPPNRHIRACPCCRRQHKETVLVPKIGDFGLAAHNKLSQESSRVLEEESGSAIFDMISSCPSSSSPRRLLEQGQTSGVGTRTYAAPEQLDETEYNEKVDIYSLGIILFELFYPFSSQMERAIMIEQLKKKGTFPSYHGCWISENDVILRMTHKDPCQRPSAMEVLELEVFHDPVVNCVLDYSSQVAVRDREMEEMKYRYDQMKQEKEDLQRKLEELQTKFDSCQIKR